MLGDPVTIYCPNPLCQAPNPESHRFCYQCRSALPKRYLWAVGSKLTGFAAGELLADRYVLKHDRIFLDTKPGLLPDLTDEVPAPVEPYLKLFPHRLHVPQIYGLVQAGETILLLEQAPIFPEGTMISGAQADAGSATLLEGRLMPALATLWKQSSSLRQLNWLWQIAHLWQPLSLQGVASTLLQPNLLRVEGGIVRLLELQLDQAKPPTLVDLGVTWRSLQEGAQPELETFLTELCDQMQQGLVRNGEQLVAVLDQALTACSQAQSYQVQIATRTDQGPSRQRNEDACYPPGGTVVTIAETDRETSSTAVTTSLVMVCDGIGGHEGGDVASNLAIATLYQQLSQLPSVPRLDPQVVMGHLEQATLVANDVISKRNDSEKRQERQRMGTTLIMSLVQTHQLYLTHVGDSRAYRITSTGCHQVTVDDDLASREVRLGYASYREALLQPGSGSLIQALGMGSSSMLHPTVQRFVLDEDCLFLLCSDGLSDNDRVEQFWQTELLPVLEGSINLETASQRLVAIANSQNGHDNVTIGLVYCQVHPNAQSTEPLSASLAAPPGVPSAFTANPGRNYSEELPKTQVLRRQRSSNLLTWLTAALAGLLAMGGLVFWLLPELRQATEPLGDDRSTPLEPGTPSPEETLSPRPTPSLSVGNLVQIDRSLLGETAQPAPLALLSQPGAGSGTSNRRTIAREVPVGTVLQIERQQVIPKRGNWLRLKVCSLPRGVSSVTQTARPGESGWIQEDILMPLVTQELGLTATQLGQCTSSPNTH